jgi:hypothetical protein
VRRTRITHVAAFVAALAGAAACASPDVGYQEDGSYVLEPRELAMSCSQLSKDIWGRLQVLKNLPWYAEWEKGNEPPTLALAWGRWFGADNKGLAHLQEYERERAHAKALDAWMVTKGCPRAFDLDRELAPIDAEIARFRL